SLALRIAFSSVAFASGSPPPSRAATVIARASLVNCWPLRESTTAFLCLILAHFECPDTPYRLLPRGIRFRVLRSTDDLQSSVTADLRSASAGHPLPRLRL